MEPPISNQPLCAPRSTRAPGRKAWRMEPTVSAPTSTICIGPKWSESKAVRVRTFSAKTGTSQRRA